MIDLTINEKKLNKAIERAKEKRIAIPTFAQQKQPETIPERIKKELTNVGLWDVNPLNLFRITWKNEPTKKGGLFDKVNYLVLPPELTGVKAKIVGLVGRWFPTGAHKVGATFGCLVPRLITGQFDPTTQKAVWPSTGNYCRGGAYNAELLGCESIAILPEGMSKERFQWLSRLAGEVIATYGSESNVKEIFDKCWELRKTRDNVMIFNQFEEFGNYLWHYEITGDAMAEVFQEIKTSKSNFTGVVLTTGSAGTIACGDYLKKLNPTIKIVAAEALQCPTLLLNGYGAHRIEGIGDKHIPWIHNVKNTDMVIGVDDEDTIAIMRLFNEQQGHAYLKELGLGEELLASLSLLGISSIGNMIATIKFARYYELTETDVIFTVFTDSMELYGSRIRELEEEFGPYNRENAIIDFHRHLLGIKTDHLLELKYTDKKRIHNLKYYTWVEQQSKDVEELDAQWYDDEYWEQIPRLVRKIDKLIEAFNKKVGLYE